jgi:hypothetical protein
MEALIMRSVKLKMLIICTVVAWLALTGTSIQTADAATWSFHFTYPDCPGGDLEVWATKDCVRRLLLVKGYAKNCETYIGHVPGAPYNDLIFDFYWDFSCNNEDHIKIALPGWDPASGEWVLKELPPWIDAHVTGEIPPLISIGDPTGQIQRVYIVVNPEEWRDNYSGNVLDEYDIQDGKCEDLPGYLIGTTPIVFDACGLDPFSTVPLNGILYRDGEIELIPAPQIDPTPIFYQLDWVGPFPPVAESSWGRIRLENCCLPRGFHYLNLSVDTNGDGFYTPVIQNMSIEAVGGPIVIDSFFDLFAEEQDRQPHDIPVLQYMYSIDEAPQQEPPSSEQMTADVISIPYQIGSESDVTYDDLPMLYPYTNFCFVKKSGQLPNLGSFVNQPQQPNYCAPGAISNSLKYLQANGGIDTSVDTDIDTVAGHIGTTWAGTDSGWYLLKDELSYFTDIVTTRYIEAPLDDAEIDDLINELNRGQDIEMDLKGHVEVLAGLRVRCDGTVELDLFDDNQTDALSDPMHTSIIDESSGTPRVDGMELERFVIECPIEEVLEIPPWLFLDTLDDWFNALAEELVRAMTLEEGEGYLWQWNPNNPEVELEGEPYPQDPFLPAEPPTGGLYVYEGNDVDEEPNDAGLVMGWGNSEGDSTSAWVVKYPNDPDLTNCIITLVVTAPQWAMTSPGSQINKVSFGLGNPPAGTGPVRSWSWDCGPGKTIQWNTPTILKIDTSKTGMTAATPTADGYTNNLAFNLTNVTWLCVDENGTWVGGPNPAPGPGGFQFLWNYWHWIMVSPKTTVDKGIYKKWSQPPIVLDPNHDPPMILGWDEYSNYHLPAVADDWECKDDRPVTDIHWWGSYHHWTQPFPPALPRAFHIGIWTNVPVDPADPNSFSHPGDLVWENYCDNYVWNFAGYDKDPRNNLNFPGEPGFDEPVDACFQFTQLLSQDEWFYQEPTDDPNNPRIYWLSIAPRWDSNDIHPDWGWKTRPWYFEDDAVIIHQAHPWPPVVGATKWMAGIPIQHPPYPDPEGVSWDVAFELTTNEPAYEDNPIPGDSNLDGEVNFIDVAITAAHWLEKAPGF